MTRGYVAVIRGKEIKKVAYLQSDAYLSYYGEKILKAITNNTIDKWMDKQIAYNHECYGEDKPNKDFSLDWIRKSKTNKDRKKYDFAEYGYLYDEKTGKLKAYHYGQLMCTVIPEEREKYQYMFENEDALWAYVNYDEELLNYKKKPQSIFLLKNEGMDMLKYMVATSKKQQEERIFLSDSHLMAPGHSHGHPTYFKKLYFKWTDNPISFVVSQSSFSKSWDVLIQETTCRKYLTSQRFGTETAAMKWLRAHIKANLESYTKQLKECSLEVAV